MVYDTTREIRVVQGGTAMYDNNQSDPEQPQYQDVFSGSEKIVYDTEADSSYQKYVNKYV